MRRPVAGWRGPAAVLLLLLFLIPASARAEAGRDARDEVLTMTVDEAVFLAVRHNRNIQSAAVDRVVQRYGLFVAERKFWPVVEGQASLFMSEGWRGDSLDGEASASSARGKNLGLGASLAQKIPTGADFTLSFANEDAHAWRTATEEPAFSDAIRRNTWEIVLSQPLLRGAGLDVNRASVQKARLGEQQNVVNLKATLLDVVSQAIYAYRAFVQAAGQTDIARMSLERSRQLLEVNRALIAAGRMAAVEIVQTEADLAGREFAYQQTLNDLDGARTALLKVLDIDRRTRIAPAPVEKVEEIRPLLDDCLRLAYANRTDWLQAQISRQLADLDALLARNNRLCDLAVETAYGHGDAQARDAADSQSDDWRLGLTLRVPLYGEYAREAGDIAARAGVRRAELSVEEARDNLETDVREALRDVTTGWTQVRLAVQARQLSERKLTVESEKLRLGRSSNFQIVTFQNDLALAQKSELDARIAYLNALTRLDQVLGSALDTWRIDFRNHDRLQARDLEP